MSLTLPLLLLFWFFVAGILHTYLVYPVILSRLGKLARRRREQYEENDEWPTVHVVMAMYNEEAVIGQTLESIMASDYPADKLQVYLGSDNSTDRSHNIVGGFQDDHSNIHLEIFGGRNGKIKIINSLVEKIERDSETVLILCDANVTWSPKLARQLARHFKDSAIGVVASTVLEEEESNIGIAAEEGAYVNQENAVKHAEGVLWGRMMGAFGACYAMRRNLYQPVPNHFNVDDFFETMVTYEQGFDGIVDLEALCFEAVSQDINEEFRRKQRISKGNFQNFKRFFSYYLPWNCGLATCFAFWSHKGLRWFGPLLLIGILTSGLALSFLVGGIYSLATIGMLCTFLMAYIDKELGDRRIPVLRKLRFIRYFYAMNLALLMGGMEFCRGVRNSVWEPTKRVAAEKNS